MPSRMLLAYYFHHPDQDETTVRNGEQAGGLSLIFLHPEAPVAPIVATHRTLNWL